MRDGRIRGDRMKDIFLNLIPKRNRAELHGYFISKLDLPPYYGGNLDALYECVSEIVEDTRISVAVSEDADWYTRKAASVFEEAAEDNEHLTVCLITD